MFQVKVCGVTNIDDALAALAAGADAIGLNFYPDSVRYVRPEVAAGIAAAVGGRAVVAGVFVNSTPDEIHAIAKQCRLDLVQLHGDEPPTDLRSLAGLPVMRAFRVAGELESARRYLEVCLRLSTLPRLILVDAAAPGQFGGSGMAADWDLLAAGQSVFAGLPIVLAGGLHAGNVAAAIAAVRPTAVDVASGVEVAPGKKSAERMLAFVQAARQGLAAHAPRSNPAR